MLEIERGSTRSHSVESSLWKRLLACRKTDYGMEARRLKLKEKTFPLDTCHVWVKKQRVLMSYGNFLLCTSRRILSASLISLTSCSEHSPIRAVHWSLCIPLIGTHSSKHLVAHQRVILHASRITLVEAEKKSNIFSIRQNNQRDAHFISLIYSN